MRISPVAYFYYHAGYKRYPLIERKSLTDIRKIAEEVTIVTHNHPEGIKGALAVTDSIVYALSEISRDDIRKFIKNDYGYDMYRKVDDIRPGYSFDLTCQGSVSEAIICALESTSYEDAIRNAVSLGGDADTQATITGSIAEAIWGIEPYIMKTALDEYIPSDVAKVLLNLYAVIA